MPGPVSVAEYLDVPTANTPVWRSDTEITYLSDVSGAPQLWQVTLGPDGTPGDPVQLTTFPDRIGALVAGKNGRVMFGKDTGGDERQQIWTLNDKGEPEAITEDPATMHPFGAISADSQAFAFASNARARGAFDVWTIDLSHADNVPQLLLATDELLTPVAWLPDGKTLIVERANSNLDCDLLLVALDGGTPTLLTPHQGEASIHHVAVTPAGDALYATSNQEREFAALIRLDLTTLEQTAIVAPEWDVESLALSPDGRTIACSINEDGFSRVLIRDLESGSEQAVAGLPKGVATGLKWSPNGELLALSVSGSQDPQGIWLADRGGAARKIAGSDPAFATPLVPATVIRYPTFDGRQIPAYWFQPEGDGPFPVVVDVHGGPESQHRPEWRPTTQALVAMGFAVLATNVRGSTGYGKTYCHLDDVEKRMDSVNDLAHANQWLREQPTVIADKIGVFGQSYGGFMVLASLTTYPELWAAGLDVVGIANFVTFLENTGPWRRKTRADEYGDLVRDAELLPTISPINKADEIVAPLFVIHGRNDPRVPIGESEQIVSKLQSLGREATLLVFEDEGHGMIKRVNRVKGYGDGFAFFERVLGAS